MQPKAERAEKTSTAGKVRKLRRKSIAAAEVATPIVESTSLVEQSADESASRKALRKKILSQRLEKKLMQLSSNTDPVRHDVKHTSSSFWRLRKEKKKRTLFLGNMPKEFRLKDVTTFLQQRCGFAPEEVDVLGGNGASQRLALKTNAFVTFDTIDHARTAQQILDKLDFHGTRLRCNFSDDKTERAKAIQKRVCLNHVALVFAVDK
jgi:RNA recognition motif-containing protein